MNLKSVQIMLNKIKYILSCFDKLELNSETLNLFIHKI